MHITYTVVSNPHPHTLLGQLKRTHSGVCFWTQEEYVSDYAVLATLDQGKLVGIQKFDVANDALLDETTLDSGATYVWPLYREEGIANGMWSTALRELRITKVNAYVISDKGKTLIEGLQEKFPTIAFKLLDKGDRKLRNLKGKKKLA